MEVEFGKHARGLIHLLLEMQINNEAFAIEFD